MEGIGSMIEAGKQYEYGLYTLGHGESYFHGPSGSGRRDFDHSASMLANFDILGREGWQMCGISVVADGNHVLTFFWFYREVKNES